MDAQDCIFLLILGGSFVVFAGRFGRSLANGMEGEHGPEERARDARRSTAVARVIGFAVVGFRHVETTPSMTSPPASRFHAALSVPPTCPTVGFARGDATAFLSIGSKPKNRSSVGRTPKSYHRAFPLAIG